MQTIGGITVKKLPPSIFNDVIGPIMRGPSSSHVAGASRIGALVRAALNSDVKKAVVDFDVNGSLAESHDGHGTDMGFICGIMGMEITDPGSANYQKIAEEKGISAEFRISDYGAVHPNHYRIEAFSSDGKSQKWDAVSVGGGMVEMISFDGFKISLAGDFYELLIKLDESKMGGLSASDFTEAFFPDADFILYDKKDTVTLAEVKLASIPDKKALAALQRAACAAEFVLLPPILPVHSRRDCQVPFLTASDMLRYAEKNGLEMWELAALYEARRGDISREEVLEKMSEIAAIMENCVDEGLKGTEYRDRILGRQSHLIEKKNEKLIPCSLLNEVIKSITAVMEVKSSMGVIIAAPTAGSCGCLPGTIIAAARHMNLSREDIAKALLAAGLIGIFIAHSATFAAEAAGCQVECGAASGMTAAGMAQLMGGSPAECVCAASMALQSVTGLACDPVANRVEVPCLGKNIMGGTNAISAANIALAGYDIVIPLDETIAAMYDIGQKLPIELRCTFGGLGKTPASLAIRKKLEGKA